MGSSNTINTELSENKTYCLCPATTCAPVRYLGGFVPEYAVQLCFVANIRSTS